jgi:hypothetical protein
MGDAESTSSSYQGNQTAALSDPDDIYAAYPENNSFSSGANEESLFKSDDVLNMANPMLSNKKFQRGMNEGQARALASASKPSNSSSVYSENNGSKSVQKRGSWTAMMGDLFGSSEESSSSPSSSALDSNPMFRHGRK